MDYGQFHGVKVSKIGLGGEGVLRTYGNMSKARKLIKEALDNGVTYFDSARVYSDSELYYGSIWKENPKLRQSVFQTSKSAARDKEGAIADLHASLRRLQTDYLDLWQIHDVRSEDDLKAIGRPGGALEAFKEAKKNGKVKFIGVTGHHDPYVLTRAVEDWPVDSVLLPVNPVEEILGGFMDATLEAARKKKLEVIGMKVLGGGHYILPKFQITAEDLIRYAMSFNITMPIVGCSNVDEVNMLTASGIAGKLDGGEKKRIVDVFRPYAPRLAFYRGAL